ncbi:MAG: MOSC N-terminal beta barrel domain-containing protein, partial [Anaerolineales bacterium]
MITVSDLYYYPIKSCRGYALQTAVLDARGISHDR